MKIIIISIVALLSICDAFDYCTLSSKHTMCRYEGIGEECLKFPDQFSSKPPTSSEKEFIVNYHNEMRRKVAKGEETRSAGENGQPSAADMYKMEWDSEIAATAQRLADQCVFQHDCCRGVANGRYFAVGQNVAMGYMYDNSSVNYNVIHSWYENEVSRFDPENISPFRYNSSSGHYTQVVNWKTRSIGCGAVIYNSGNAYYKHLIVCNYGPSGNLAGSELYLVGNPCQRCPLNTTCEDGLCALDAGVDRLSKLRSDQGHTLRPLNRTTTDAA